MNRTKSSTSFRRLMFVVGRGLTGLDSSGTVRNAKDIRHKFIGAAHAWLP
jgi:hypothetical protein